MTSIDPAGPTATSADLPQNVLVVEDDPLIAFDTVETIRSFGIASVRTARDVTGALQAIADQAPAFVLLDVGLFKENSAAVAEQLDALKIPFAFVTGYSGDSGVPASFAHHAVLIKPYLRDELLATLRKWRDRA